MTSTGSGATFSDEDIKMAKRISVLLTSGDFKVDGVQMLQGADALRWFAGTLLPGMEANVLELLRVSKPPETPSPEVAQ